jgi:hypothetical protein
LNLVASGPAAALKQAKCPGAWRPGISITVQKPYSNYYYALDFSTNSLAMMGGTFY